MPPLLSAHSSNPLESPRKRRLEPYTKKRHDSDAMMQSSDDPISGYEQPELQEQVRQQVRRREEANDMTPRPWEKKPRSKPNSRALRSMKNEERTKEESEAEVQEVVEEVEEVYVESDDEELVVGKGQLDDFAMGDVEDERDGEVKEHDGDQESLEIVDGDMVDDPEDAADEEPDSDEEEIHTIELKPEDERQEILEEIADLERVVPILNVDYQLVDRLGSGTFSSVYKAVDLGYHNKWDNSTWHGQHPSTSSAHYQSVPLQKERKAFVAIKRIYVTSNPERIRNEIAILEDCRSCRHVSQLITAFRDKDQVVAIMPYHRNMDFRDFYQLLPMPAIKSYLRCMFRALRDIHARMIIHRDVKPANFLFDPRTGIGTLCDFGLASRIEPTSSNQCLHEPATPENPHGCRKRPLDSNYVKRMIRDAQTRSAWPSDRVGYPEKEIRPHSRANRAGTRGFRAPEVLLKCNEQTGAVDVWAAGVILLFFLSKKFPLFHSNDDVEATMEIATVIGQRKMERAATLHSRLFITNVPSITDEGMSWKDFCLRQNPTLLELPPYVTDQQLPEASWAGGDVPTTLEEHQQDVKDALELVEKLLEPESVKRPIPEVVLRHPFLRVRTARRDSLSDGDSGVVDEGKEEEYEDDDAFFPHPLGHGVCGKLHRRGESGLPMVRLRTGEWIHVAAGEGIAIGYEPCEFHRDDFAEGDEGHGNSLGEDGEAMDDEDRT